MPMLPYLEPYMLEIINLIMILKIYNLRWPAEY